MAPRRARTPQFGVYASQRVKTLRRALAPTQEEFAARFRIPLGTVRDWEQAARSPTTRLKPTSPSSRAIPKASIGHCVPCAANRRFSTLIENLASAADIAFDVGGPRNKIRVRYAFFLGSVSSLQRAGRWKRRARTATTPPESIPETSAPVRQPAEKW